MAPRKRKAAAPVTPPFDGFSIAISGTIPGRTQAAIETDFITPLGGVLAKSVSASTTQLVTTEADYNKPSVKVKSAQANGIPIVTFQWLEDCLAQNTRLDEATYALASQSQSQSQSQAQVNGSTRSNGSRKRAASQTPQNGNDDIKPPQPKKKGRAKKDVKVEEVEEAEKVEKDEKDEKDKPAEREPKIAEGQIAKSSDVRIPLDEGACRELVNYEVYIDDDGVIYDASLNQTNAGRNNNKFYRIQLLRSVAGDYRTWTRWGRVGEYGQSKAVGNGSLDDALKQFNDKFKSKSGLSWDNRGEQPKPNKYAFIEKSYEPDSEDDEEDEGKIKAEVNEEDEPESTLSHPVQDLMKLIFNQEYFTNAMTDLNYDSAKLPLGKLSKATISRGFQALKDLSSLLDDPSLATSQYGTSFSNAAEQLSNAFFTIIPHAFGRNRPPVIQTQAALKKEIELLESLGDMKDAALLMKADKKEEINQLDRQFRGLGLNEMTPLSNASQEFIQLKEYLMQTRGSTHNANYQVAQIFRIERDGEFDRFDASHKTPRDRRLLWHGSRCTNFGGILSQGLRIAPPEAPATGYMFGKGIYLADMSSKSANYCCSHISNGHALLLLCEAELGDPLQKLTDASYNAGDTAKANGMLSTWGQGSTGPSTWKDAECVHPSLKGVKIPDVTVTPGPTNIPNAYLLYNEYICYDISQVRLRYLLRVRM
ncbi:poly polymerase catalytic domain-containing protein [Xylaria cf. heliscus]|nr:poly polymerase catalytic domain-containing protein [Xylaria cf. heliscus]